MTATISRSVPPQRLINLVNPVVRGMMESRLHKPMDDALLVLHVTGRRTGRHYDIPVGYVDLDGQLVVTTQHLWRVNLRGGADIEVTRRGRRETMHAQLDEDPASIANTVQRVIERCGPKKVHSQFGLKIRDGHTPTLFELEEAVREFGLATITLTARGVEGLER